MRYGVLAGIWVVLATWSGFVCAQGTSPFYVGAPVAINNVPIDTSRALRPNTSFGQGLLGSSKSPLNTGLGLSSFFKTSPLSLPTFPAKAPTSSVLPQAQNPFQPTFPKGAKGPLDGGKIVSNPAQSLLGTSLFGSK